jgi:hypothetical protein
MAKVEVRKGMPGVQLTKAEFATRVRERFYDPSFEPLSRTALLRPCRYATGTVRVIPTTPWARSMTGWRKFIRAGLRRME